MPWASNAYNAYRTNMPRITDSVLEEECSEGLAGTRKVSGNKIGGFDRQAFRL